MLREFVFKTAGANNPLCRFTAEDEQRWIVIHVQVDGPNEQERRALFLIHAPPEQTQRFLHDVLGKRHAAFKVIKETDDVTTVAVSNYTMPSYRGADPLDLTRDYLGEDVVFDPILVQGGYFHFRVIAVERTGDEFSELTSRLRTATSPTDFRLVHSGRWDPARRLRPRDDLLSSRQAGAVRMAVDLGYYDIPRRCTLQDLAEAFGVSKAAVHKHLQAAESKIMRNAL